MKVSVKDAIVSEDCEDIGNPVGGNTRGEKYIFGLI